MNFTSFSFEFLSLGMKAGSNICLQIEQLKLFTIFSKDLLFIYLKNLFIYWFRGWVLGLGRSKKDYLWYEILQSSRTILSFGTYDVSDPLGADIFNQYAKFFFRLVQTMDYSVIVFDTAPTGHTLRLLQFPSTLEKGLGKMMKLKNSFGGLLNQVCPHPPTVLYCFPRIFFILCVCVSMLWVSINILQIVVYCFRHHLNDI